MVSSVNVSKTGLFPVGILIREKIVLLSAFVQSRKCSFGMVCATGCASLRVLSCGIERAVRFVLFGMALVFYLAACVYSGYLTLFKSIMYKDDVVSNSCP